MIDDCKLHSKVLPCLVLLYLALLPILKEFSSLSNTSGVILVQSKSIYKSKRDSIPRPYDSGTNVVNYSTYFVYCSSQYVTRFSHSQLCQQSSRVWPWWNNNCDCDYVIRDMHCTLNHYSQTNRRLGSGSVDQRSGVRIQSLANFYIEHLFSVKCIEKTKINQKRPGNNWRYVLESKAVSKHRQFFHNEIFWFWNLF